MSTLPNTEENETPEQLLAGLEAYIDAASGMLEQGNMVDLAGLDAVVDILCARVLKLPPEQGQPFADKFDVLHARLGALQEKMVATQAELKTEMEQSSMRQKASRAYLKDHK